MFRDEFTPTEESHTYEFPKELYGKKVIIESEEPKTTRKDCYFRRFNLERFSKI